MNEQLRPGALFQQFVGADMVKMSVGVDYFFDFKPPLRNLREDQFTVGAGIYHHPDTGSFTAEHETVDSKLSYHNDIQRHDSSED
jgi:hypothetical protein